MTETRASPSEQIATFVERLARANPSVAPAVVLVGSVARGTAHSDSDLDLVVVTVDSVIRVPSLDGLHVQYFTRAELLERLRLGDDFAAWCVRFGIPVRSEHVWTEVFESPEARIWPNWRAKLLHAARRLHLTSSMLGHGDLDAATEEVTYALTHVGRALLLKRGLFPLSRPEMIVQLNEAGYRALSRLLEGFIYHPRDNRAIRQAVRYAKKLLVHLDRAWYGEHVAARRRRAALKSANRQPAGTR